MWLLAALMAVCGVARAAGDEPGVLRATLTNGLSVIIVRNPLAPVVTTIINYRVGSDECPAGFPGTAHAVEHMMFRGSPGLTADQLAMITAGMGGDVNADTQQAITQYFFTVPASDLGVALRIEALRIRGLLPDKALWDKERGAIEQEVAQDLSNPEYVLYMKLLEALFRGTPYAHDALGTRPSFDQTTDAMLREFHQTWYVPNNAILIIVGDVDPAQALKEVKAQFEGLPTRKLPEQPAFHFEPVKAETIKLESDQPRGTAAIAFRFPGTDSTNYAAATVLGDVLSSQRGTLYQLVVEGKALAAAFEYEALPKAGIGYAVAEFPAGADADALLEQVRAIVTAAASNGVPADLVEAAKRRELTSEELQKNSVFGLGMEWSQAVALEGRQSPQEDIDAIRRVTVADVNRVAREYLSLDHAVSAILTPQPSGKPVSSRGFGGTETFTPTHVTKTKLPRWAEQAVNELKIPPSTLNPVVTTLPNGLQVIVQPSTISDTVSVYGRIRSNSNLEAPKGQEGVDQVLDQLLSYGTKTLDRVAFQTALDEIGAVESPGTDFSLQVLAEHFDRGVQLLADNQLSPALPEDAFKIIQPELAAAVAGELESPSYLASRALRIGLFPSHDPSLRQATPETVKALTIQDVRNYHQKVFRPDLSAIVVIGKVTPSQAQAVIAKYFGSWQGVGPTPPVVLPAVPTNAPATTHVPDASRVQDKVTLAEALTLTRTNADYYPLELGNHVLGGGFYATRLYRDLRENQGLVYFVSSTFQVGLARGIYEVSYACDPPNVAKARAIVVDNLRAMRKDKVSEGELRQAKVLLLREIPLSEASVQKVANGWLSRFALELPLDEPTLAAHRYVKLSAGDVRAAFAKWLRPGDLVQVTQGPVPK
ncbi:MAG TPA: pitrilysin family protein [Candidatus Acidoferrum sp.]|nr:pitrilysin family protein [Candidatus Acidoferrum sp.]